MTNSLKNLLLTLILSLISVILAIYPLLSGGTRAAIYNFEPEVVYISNALKYTLTHEIIYSDHPGTPAIVLVAKSFVPLRLYAKYIVKTPFLNWTIRNQAWFYYYSRLFQTGIFFLALLLFLNSIRRVSSSGKTVFFAWLALMSFSYFLYLGPIIQSEPTSFLIISIWFVFFIPFMSKPSIKYLIPLAFLSGLSISNKFTNISYPLASLLFVFSLPAKKISRRFYYLFVTGLLVVTGFIFGIWPVRNNYPFLINWIIRLATHSGVHGGGSPEIFSPVSYFHSLTGFTQSEKGIFLIMVLAGFGVFNALVRKRIKISHPLVLFFLSLLSWTLVMAKYPLNHYQTPNVLGFIFIASVYFTATKKYLRVIIVSFLLLIAAVSTSTYLKDNIREVKMTLALEQFVSTHPALSATVWEWGKSLDFSLLHSRGWIGKTYSDILTVFKPNLYDLTVDMKGLNLVAGDTKPVFSVCWDQLYIQGSELQRFISLYPDHRLVVTPIPESKNMLLVTSTHCL